MCVRYLVIVAYEKIGEEYELLKKLCERRSTKTRNQDRLASNITVVNSEHRCFCVTWAVHGLMSLLDYLIVVGHERFRCLVWLTIISQLATCMYWPVHLSKYLRWALLILPRIRWECWWNSRGQTYNVVEVDHFTNLDRISEDLLLPLLWL